MKLIGRFGKKKLIIACLAVLLVCLGVVSYFLFFTNQQTTLKIASTTDVIKYFDNNGITEYFNDKLNIDIKWMDYGNKDAYEAINEDLSKEKEELPDAYLGFELQESEMQALASEAFLDITNIVNSNTKEFKRVIAEDTSRLAEFKVDGKIYSFPTLYEEYSSEYPQKVWINEQWLNDIGEDIPTTTDEFYDILVKFKENDLNGNEKKDEIPLGVAYKGGNNSTLGFLVNAFVTTDYDLSDVQSYLSVDDDGEVYTAVTKKEYKEALEYINKLIDKDLLEDDIFEKEAIELMKGTSAAEIYGVIAAQDLNAVFNNPERAKNYVPLPPLVGNTQGTLVKRTSVRSTGYMLGRYTENREAALKLGDAMLTQDGTLTVLFGKEGENWNKADNRVTAMGAVESTWKAGANAEANAEIKGKVPYWYAASVSTAMQATADESGNVDLQTEQNWTGYLNKVTREVYEPVGKLKTKNVYPGIVYNDEQEQKLLEDNKDIRTEVYSYIVEASRDFVLGDKDFDDDWDDYKEELNKKGLKTILEVSQEAYDKSR